MSGSTVPAPPLAAAPVPATAAAAPAAAAVPPAALAPFTFDPLADSCEPHNQELFAAVAAAFADTSVAFCMDFLELWSVTHPGVPPGKVGIRHIPRYLPLGTVGEALTCVTEMTKMNSDGHTIAGAGPMGADLTIPPLNLPGFQSLAPQQEDAHMVVDGLIDLRAACLAGLAALEWVRPVTPPPPRSRLGAPWFRPG